jgi:hypothetical protein
MTPDQIADVISAAVKVSTIRLREELWASETQSETALTLATGQSASYRAIRA